MASALAVSAGRVSPSISMVFSVVLFTIVVQGSLLEPILRAMGLTNGGPAARPQETGTADVTP